MKEFLDKCKSAYYAGEPIISDSQYDALVEEHGEEYIGTQNGTIPHRFPMYSLKKYYVGEDEFPNLGKVIVTPKLDGAAISLLYKNGFLIRALTRGNGILGEDITEKAMHLRGVPKVVDTLMTIQITGEVVSPMTIPNARNYASGSLSLKSLEEFKTRDVTFYAYSLDGHNHLTYSSILSYLRSLQFNTVDTKSDVIEMFPTDGQVARMDNNQEFQRLGYTSKYPRGAYAIKERTEGVETTLNEVVWQVGKSGKVTPVALLEPIEIDGAVVSRATLNNVGFIQSLGLRLGDRVKVERSGGIIPRIISKA